MSNKTTPSLLALLGLVAFAGYQNRTRIGEMLDDARLSTHPAGIDQGTGADRGGFLAEIGQTLQSSFAGSGLSTALGDLVARFRAAGQGAAADSWVSAGANQPVNVDELESAIGPETLTDLVDKTGLSQKELLLRLNAALPEVVDRLTPNGRLPHDDDAQTLIRTDHP